MLKGTILRVAFPARSARSVRCAALLVPHLGRALAVQYGHSLFILAFIVCAGTVVDDSSVPLSRGTRPLRTFVHFK